VNLNPSSRFSPPVFALAFLALVASCPGQTAPTAAAAPPTAPVPAADPKTVVLDKFSVFASSRADALQQQRAADTVGNFISPDLLGSLPDDTVGDALNRLPGLNVVEGSELSIRGAEGKLNLVTLDGIGLPATSRDTSTTRGGDTRNFDVSSIPTETIKSIEVLKSLTADRDASAVGGIVNLETADAFTLKKRLVRTRAEFRYREQGDNPGWASTFTYGDVLNAARTLGLILNLTYRDETENRWQTSVSNANTPPFNPDGSAKIPVLNSFTVREDRRESSQFTASATLDWRISPQLALSFRPYVSRIHADGVRPAHRFEQLNSSRSPTFLDAAGAPSATPTLYRRVDELRFRPQDRTNISTKDLRRFVLAAKADLPSGLLSGALAYGGETNATRERQFDFDTFSNDPNNLAVFPRRLWRTTIDNTVYGRPLVRSTLVTNPAVSFFESTEGRATTLLEKIREQQFSYADDQLTGQFDYVREPAAGGAITFKTGGKALHRWRTNTIDFSDWNPNHLARGRNITVADFASGRPLGSFDQRYAYAGPVPSLPSVLAFFDNNRALFNPRTAGSEYNAQATRNYEAAETILAGYGMATGRWGALTLIGGLRYEFTATRYTWLASRLTPPVASLPRLTDETGRSRYDGLFPSTIATYRLGEHHVFRGAFSTSVARPDFEQLIPFNEAAIRSRWGATFVTDTELDIGNPKLKAQTAANYDLAYEFYYGKGNGASLNLFRKELKNFQFTTVFQSVVQVSTDPLNPAAPTVPEIRNTNFVANGSRQTVQGIELSWTHSFRDQLPRPFDGLGFLANYTFIKGEEVQPLFDPATRAAIGRRTSTTLTGQPDTIANLQLYYDLGQLSARVAFNSVSELQDSVASGVPRLFGPRETVDLSVQYRLGKRYRVFLDVKNVTDAPSRNRYDAIPAFNNTFRREAPRLVIVGLRGDF